MKINEVDNGILWKYSQGILAVKNVKKAAKRLKIR